MDLHWTCFTKAGCTPQYLYVGVFHYQDFTFFALSMDFGPMANLLLNDSLEVLINFYQCIFMQTQDSLKPVKANFLDVWKV